MSITLSRWSKAPYIFINGELDDRAEEALDEELSYEVPDASHTDAWKRGDWDGRERLLRDSKNGNKYFPAGCLSRARRVLDALGVEYEVEGVVRPGRGDFDFAWDTDMTLREYQSDAVRDAIIKGAGVVTMPTGGGKTLCGVRIAYELSRSTLVLCHRQEIADQWVDDLRDILGADVAKCYGGTRENGDVQVALYQSIYEDGDIRDDVRLDHDVLLADEAHRVGADKFSMVALGVNAQYRFGFSATPDREDNATLKVIGGTGEILCNISPEKLIEDGYLAEPTWKIIETPGRADYYRNWQEEYKQYIVENPERNEIIASEVNDMLPKPCLVTVERIDHGERLVEMIDDAVLVHGDAKNRSENIQSFRDGDIDVMVATRGIVGEGFDVPEIISMVVAGGLKSGTSMIQQVGRALRPDTDEATIVDLMDSGNYVGDHAEERIRTYKEYYGEYGP